jgi:hypothetical protein
MACRFYRFNLISQIKKRIITPLEGTLTTDDYNCIKDVTLFGLSTHLNLMFVILSNFYKTCSGNNYSISKVAFNASRTSYKLELLEDLKSAILIC